MSSHELQLVVSSDSSIDENIRELNLFWEIGKNVLQFIKACILLVEILKVNHTDFKGCVTFTNKRHQLGLKDLSKCKLCVPTLAYNKRLVIEKKWMKFWNSQTRYQCSRKVVEYWYVHAHTYIDPHAYVLSYRYRSACVKIDECPDNVITALRRVLLGLRTQHKLPLNEPLYFVAMLTPTGS